MAAETGIEVISIEADYTGELGAWATREMLSRPDPPTAIFYDNDVMAVAGLGEAQRICPVRCGHGSGLDCVGASGSPGPQRWGMG